MARPKGIPCSLEHRKLLSKAMMGKSKSPEAIRRFVESRRAGKGFIPSEETRKKMSEVHKGKPSPKKGRNFGSPSEETRKKMSLALKGHKGCVHSEESKKKISDGHKGRPSPWRDKHPSEESRKKMSEARKGKWVGENNSNWNGGSSFLPYPPIFNGELKQFIKNRDNNECQNPFCKHEVKRLDTHHVDYNKQNCSQFNLITLCRQCNAKANANRKEWERFYKKIIWNKY